MAYRHIPIMAFAVLAFLLALVQPATDVTLFFVPAARIMAHGGNVYALSSQALPFVYPPMVLPLFMLYGLPGAYLLAILANVSAALWIVRAQRVSYWWLLYPPLLTACYFGTFDLPVVALALLAYRRRSPLLMALALLVKPQAAIFWLVPYAAEEPRVLWRIGAVGAMVTAISMLLLPETWSAWLVTISARPTSLATHYSIGGYSVFAIGAYGVFTALSRLREGQWRALTALTVPFIRQYSAVGLIGYGPTWVILLAWALVALAVSGVRMLWLEPVAVLGIWMMRERHGRT